MPDANYTRGATTDPMSPPNPQGQAKTTNEMADAVPDFGLNPQEAVQFGITGKPAPAVPNPSNGGDRHAFMFAPTDRPNESVTYGLNSAGQMKPPENLGQWLPDLRAAAMEPDADPAVRRLYDTIAQALQER